MNKIHQSQLFAILMLSAAWSVICLPEAGGAPQLLGIAAAFAVQFLLSLPMLLLSDRGFSLSHTVSHKKWLGFIYILFFLLWGAHGFSQLWDVSAEISLPVSGSLTAAVLITVTCLYTCSLGLKTMARCAPFVLALLLLSVIVLIIGAYSRMDITRLAPQTDGFLLNGFSYFCIGGELTAAWVLLDRVNAGQKLAVRGYLAAKAAFACLVTFLSVCAAGRLSALSGYPFFTLTALSQPLQNQRADALYILMFVMLYVMHITLQTGVISHLLTSMFPRFKGAAPLSLAVMLFLSWGMGLTGDAMTFVFGILIFVTAFIIPLIFYLLRRFSHEDPSVSSNASAPPRSDGMRNGTHQ